LACGFFSYCDCEARLIAANIAKLPELLRLVQ